MAVKNDANIKNIYVEVVTPPPFQDPPLIPQETITPVFYAYSTTTVIPSDGVTSLVQNVNKRQHIREPLIKGMDPVWLIGSTSPPPPPPNPPLPDGVFDGKDDYSLAMPGMTLANPEKYTEYPTGIFIKETSSIISLPYLPKDPKTHRNGTQNDSRVLSPRETPYLWESDNPIIDPITKRSVDALSSRPDGFVDMEPQERNAKKARNPIKLTPGNRETEEMKNDNLNAFALQIGVVPGWGQEQLIQKEWYVKIEFGEVTVWITENSGNIKIKMGTNDVVLLDIPPGSSVRTTSNQGSAPLTLCFIPVWNGLLVSDGPPDTPNWPDKVTYVQKDLKRSAIKQINEILWPENERSKPREFPFKLPKHLNRRNPPLSETAVSLEPSFATDVDTGSSIKVTYSRCGGTLKFTPIYFPTNLKIHFLDKGSFVPETVNINSLPVPVIPPPSEPDSPGITSPLSHEATEGINFSLFIETNVDSIVTILSGLPPGLTFVPARDQIWGAPTTAGDYQVLVKAKNRATGKISYSILNIRVKAALNIPSEDVFDMPMAKNVKIIPILYYKDNSNLLLAARQAILPSSENTPYNDSVVHYKKENKYTRLPVETWGFIIYRKEENYLTFRNDEGFLTINDVPKDRIRSVSIDRSLDGSSGSIVWDRYDPVTGLAIRPIQNVGSIRILAKGGENTVPGIIFTGIAMGNSMSNTSTSNEVEVPLSGRESKLSEEGGLRLVNVPFFDGWEHSDVMQFLCNYGGVPFVNRSTPYRLPASFNIQEAVVDYETGSAVLDSMGELSKMAGTIFFFTRKGELYYTDVYRTTGRNWDYPEKSVVTYSDTPDFTSMRNNIVLSAFVADSRYSSMKLEDRFKNLEMVSPVLMSLRITTTPNFNWDKMMFYTIGGVLPSQAEFNRIAIQVAKGVARPRATGSVSIPGNAEIELLDTFNSNWVITQISHGIDTQAKTWETSLKLELFVDSAVQGTATILPVADIDS